MRRQFKVRINSASPLGNRSHMKRCDIRVFPQKLSCIWRWACGALAPRSAPTHAATGVNGFTVSTTFTYDPNGNELTGNGRATTWTSYNKPASITQGSNTISFLDDPEHQRFQQVTLRWPGRAGLAEPAAE